MTAVEIVEPALVPCGALRLLGLAEREKSGAAAATTVSATVRVCVALAPVPATVIEYVPGALLPTLTVIVEEPPAVTDTGAKLTVVPVGWPLALRLTVCAEPLVTAVEIVELPLLPCTMLKLLGLAAMEKSDVGALVTVRATVVVCVALAPVPVTVIVYVPGAVAAPTLTVIAEEVPAVTEAGLKPTVVPVGCPVALRLTVCAGPLVTAVEIVALPLEPSGMLRLLGLAASEKSDGPLVQLGNLNDAMRVCQLKAPLEARYSSVYQNVQSSTGSTLMLV